MTQGFVCRIVAFVAVSLSSSRSRGALALAQQCSEYLNYGYTLAWNAQGRNFFDGWDFLRDDFNHGASQYLDVNEAFAEKVIEAHDTHAIIRVGNRGWLYKRKSVKIASKGTFRYFLAAMRFSHVPWGCSVWPSFWPFAPGSAWPTGGELDILEWANNMPGFTSFHTSAEQRCFLHDAEVNKPGCPSMPSRQGYDCVTAYPQKLGCAPNRQPVRSGEQWAGSPGVVAVEATTSYLKVFYIPEAQLPDDLAADSPTPDKW